jgi:hypothetical protein
MTSKEMTDEERVNTEIEKQDAEKGGFGGI